MASTERDAQKRTDASAEPPESTTADKLADALAKVEIESQDSSLLVNDEKEQQQPPRPLHIYSRIDALNLSKSPLVTLPEGMPALKDWFGYVKFATYLLETFLMTPVQPATGMSNKCPIKRTPRIPVHLRIPETDGQSNLALPPSSDTNMGCCQIPT